MTALSDSDVARVRAFVAKAQLLGNADTPAPADRPWVRVMPMTPMVDDPVLENGPYIECKLLIELGQADRLYAEAFVDDPGMALNDVQSEQLLMENVAEVFVSDLEAMEHLLPVLDETADWQAQDRPAERLQG